MLILGSLLAMERGEETWWTWLRAMDFLILKRIYRVRTEASRGFCFEAFGIPDYAQRYETKHLNVDVEQIEDRILRSYVY